MLRESGNHYIPVGDRLPASRWRVFFFRWILVGTVGKEDRKNLRHGSSLVLSSLGWSKMTSDWLLELPAVPHGTLQMELYQREDQTTRCQPVANIQTFLMAWQQAMTLLSTGPLLGAVVLVNAEDPWLRGILMSRRQKPAWRMWQVLEVKLYADGVLHPVSQSTCVGWGTSTGSSALPPLRSRTSQLCVAPVRWRLQLSSYKAPWISRWGYTRQGCSNLSWSS